MEISNEVREELNKVFRDNDNFVGTKKNTEKMSQAVAMISSCIALASLSGDSKIEYTDPRDNTSRCASAMIDFDSMESFEGDAKDRFESAVKYADLVQFSFSDGKMVEEVEGEPYWHGITRVSFLVTDVWE